MLASVASGALEAAAQTKAKNAANQTGAKVCADCWSGVVNYTRTLEGNLSEKTPVFGTTDPKNEIHTEDITEKVVYTGSATINGSAGGPMPLTNADADYVSEYFHKASQTEWTRCRSFDPDRLITETVEATKWSRGFAVGPLKNFGLRAADGRFRFGFDFPDGVEHWEKKSIITRRNFCADAKPQRPNSKDAGDGKLSGERVTVEGELDPKTPDVFAGTKTWSETNASKTQKVTYLVTWRFQRKPARLMVTNIRFFRLLGLAPNDWTEIGAADYVARGEPVKIVASIANLSDQEKSATVKIKELRSNAELPGGSFAKTFPPHKTIAVEMIWDTFGDPLPDALRQIQASVPDDAMTRELQILPRP